MARSLWCRHHVLEAQPEARADTRTSGQCLALLTSARKFSGLPRMTHGRSIPHRCSSACPTLPTSSHPWYIHLTVPWHLPTPRLHMTAPQGALPPASPHLSLPPACLPGCLRTTPQLPGLGWRSETPQPFLPPPRQAPTLTKTRPRKMADERAGVGLASRGRPGIDVAEDCDTQGSGLQNLTRDVVSSACREGRDWDAVSPAPPSSLAVLRAPRGSSPHRQGGLVLAWDTVSLRLPSAARGDDGDPPFLGIPGTAEGWTGPECPLPAWPLRQCSSRAANRAGQAAHMPVSQGEQGWLG